ncbi:hypothetical protein WCLP8_1490003 [uncultured Gammaproteobacteria bacterium]
MLAAALRWRSMGYSLRGGPNKINDKA